ncbi:MAG: hypothetical protein ACK4TK_12835, partial [Thiobacillaceae bacterium]
LLKSQANRVESFLWNVDGRYAMPLMPEALVGRSWRAALSPDPTLSVAAWADGHRILSSVASDEPGRRSTGCGC